MFVPNWKREIFVIFLIFVILWAESESFLKKQTPKLSEMYMWDSEAGKEMGQDGYGQSICELDKGWDKNFNHRWHMHLFLTWKKQNVILPIKDEEGSIPSSQNDIKGKRSTILVVYVRPEKDFVFIARKSL